MIRVLPWLLLLGCAGVGDDPGATKEDTHLSDELADPLAGGSFAFCELEGANGDQLERWCPLIRDLPADVCPAAHATCEAELFDSTSLEGCQGFGPSEPSGKLAGRPEEAEPIWQLEGCEGWESPLGCDGSGLAGVGELMRWAMALAVAFLVLLLLRWIGGALGIWRSVAPSDPGLLLDLDAGFADGLEGDDDLPALPEDELLARAEEAMSHSRYGEAAIFARGAALRRLARRGLLHLHRARTDREYLRALREDPSIRDGMRTVLKAVEDHRWAGRVLSGEDARSAVDAAGRILAAGVVLLLLLPGLAHGQWDPRRAPEGDAALFELFEARGYRVGTVGELSEVDDKTDAVFLDLLGVLPSEDDWDALRAWIDAGGVLIVGGDVSDVLPDVGLRRAAPSRLGLSRGPYGAGAELDGVPRYSGGPEFVWAPDGPADDFGRREDWVVATDPDDPEGPTYGVVRVVSRGEGAVVALSDSTLLWNAALLAPQNRRFLVDLLPLGQQWSWWTMRPRPRIVLAVLASDTSDSATDSLRNARMLPFVLSLMAWWVLLAMWRGWPFGPLRDAPIESRVEFSEHAVALGGHWHRLRASRHAASAYARYIVGQVGVRGLVSRAVSAGHDPAYAAAWADRVDRLAHQATGPDTQEDLELVEELWTLTRHP